MRHTWVGIWGEVVIQHFCFDIKRTERKKQHQGFSLCAAELAQAVKVSYLKSKITGPHVYAHIQYFILQSNFCCIIQNYSQIELPLISETAAARSTERLICYIFIKVHITNRIQTWPCKCLTFKRNDVKQ